MNGWRFGKFQNCANSQLLRITADRRFAAALERVDPPVDYKLIAA